MQYLLFAALVIMVMFFIWYDKKIYGNYLSPVTILSVPLLIVIFLALIFGPGFGFRDVSTDLLVLYLAGLPVFWSSSLLFSTVIPYQKLVKASSLFTSTKPQSVFPFKNFILFLSWIVIIIMTLSFVITLKKFGHFSSIGTEEFTYEYSGYGFRGHALVAGILTLIYIIGMVRKFDIFTLITMIILIFLLLLQQVKTWLYVPIVGGLILRFYNFRKIRVNSVYVIIGIFTVILLFFLSYYFAAVYGKGDFGERTGEVFKHMTGYMFAGVLGFGEHIRNGLPVGETPENLLMPYKNIWNIIWGNDVHGVVSQYHVFIDNKNYVDVNVKTIFGTIFIYGGPWQSFIYIFIAGVVLYVNWIIAGLTRNYWMLVLYALLASPLALGWFDFYYNQLTFVELPVYIIIIMIFNKIYKLH